MPTGVYPRPPRVATLPSMCHPGRLAFVGTQCRKCYEQWANANVPGRLERNRTGARERYRRQSVEKRRAAIIGKYGLTQVEFEAMLAAQDGKCALSFCRKDITGYLKSGMTKACVDHCHATGRVRGLLCRPCNSSIGQLGDNVEGLQAAIKYLTQEQTNE